MAPLKIALRADALLDCPEFNKGSAFTTQERKDFILTSRLPDSVNSLEEQCKRAYEQLSDATDDLAKNNFLWSLREQNWVLFYGLLTRHLTELFPIIYTPTEAEAIAKFSHVFRRPQGSVFLTYANQDTLEDDFESHLEDALGRRKDVDLVVISDGGAILGIGDQGAGATGISTAKSVIYTLTAGIHPSRTLSIALDVGTNNEKLLKDPLYLGWRHERIEGQEYYDFVDKFMKKAKQLFGDGTLIHFEDFGVANAQSLLDKYRSTHPIFNDDIQGTGAVTLAALYSALHVTKGKLSEQKIVVFGAGSAGLGITRQIRNAMMLESTSSSAEEINKQFFLIDKDGLLTSATKDVREPLQEFVRQDWEGAETSLEEVIKKVKPNVLIGTSTSAGAFTEKAIKEMSKHVDRPIIFPLSNPTKLCEVQPKDANEWSAGKALLATGSPFDPVKNPDGSEYVIAECNNALIYPGIGFGAIVSKAAKVTDKMLVAATKALAELSPAIKDANASLLPDFADSRTVNFEIALAVIDAAIDEGVAGLKMEKEKRRAYAKSLQWSPEYEEYVYDSEGFM